MEGLGQKFQKARAARNLTLEEAGRMTKIRPSKLAEIEAEDFSQFPSLAYAKGFLLIYGKFLNVDVSPYLEAFETSETMTVDGYSYLQDNPVPAPRRTEVMRPRASSGGGGGGRGKSSLLPLVIGIVVLVAGFSLLKLMMDVKRITPSTQRDAQALAGASSPAPATSPGNDIAAAPRALPVDETPAPTAPMLATTPAAPATAPTAIAVAPTPAVTPQATVVANAPVVPEEGPEIRRAEPVNPEDVVKAQAALASASPKAAAVNNFDIRPLRKTYVRVIVDGGGGPAIERWLNISEAPIQLRGQRIAIKVLDPGAVEIRKNGKVVARGDADVRLE